MSYGVAATIFTVTLIQEDSLVPQLWTNITSCWGRCMKVLSTTRAFTVQVTF